MFQCLGLIFPTEHNIMEDEAVSTIAESAVREHEDFFPPGAAVIRSFGHGCVKITVTLDRPPQRPYRREIASSLTQTISYPGRGRYKTAVTEVEVTPLGAVICVEATKVTKSNQLLRQACTVLMLSATVISTLATLATAGYLPRDMLPSWSY